MSKPVIVEGDKGLKFSFDDHESFDIQRERLASFFPKFRKFFPDEALQIHLGEREGKKAEIQSLAEEAGVAVSFGKRKELLEGTRFVLKTVRSGQEVKSSGHVVVLGGVNPGGVVAAGGHIVVLGDVRGKVSAGRQVPDAFVAALAFSTDRLEIGGQSFKMPAVTYPAIVKLEKGSFKVEAL